MFPPGNFQGMPGGLPFPPGPYPNFGPQGFSPMGGNSGMGNVGMMMPDAQKQQPNNNPQQQQLQQQQQQQQHQQQQQQRGQGVYFKTRICIDFRDGWCKRGELCKYAHGDHELRQAPIDGPQAAPEPGPGRKRGGEATQGGEGGHGGAIDYSRKTRLCQDFTNLGSCRYGGKCTFAHGPAELRTVGGGAAGGGGVAGDRPMLPIRSSPAIPPPAPPPGLPSGPGLRPQYSPATASPGQQRHLAGKPGPSPVAAALSNAGATASTNVAAPKREEVTYVDRVRAVCGMLRIGNAASVEHRPAVQHAAMAAIKGGVAFRANPFADDVECYLPVKASATAAAAAAAAAAALG